MNRILNEIKEIIKQNINEYLPEVKSSDLEENGTVYYMNGKNGTEFDWYVNDHLPIFMVFYNDKQNLGVAKLLIYTNGEVVLYIYGEILSYICGDSNSSTHTIRILNVDDQVKYTTHKDADVEKIQDTALHEIVHQCHHIYITDYTGYKQTTWFSEGLATNISNQKYEIQDLNQCNFDELKTDFRHYKGNYRYAYTIVNYVLNNYSDEEIEKLYKNPTYVRESANKIFEEAKVWVNNKLNVKL